jgi:hypothetical protein
VSHLAAAPHPAAVSHPAAASHPYGQRATPPARASCRGQKQVFAGLQPALSAQSLPLIPAALQTRRALPAARRRPTATPCTDGTPPPQSPRRSPFSAWCR